MNALVSVFHLDQTVDPYTLIEVEGRMQQLVM